MKIHGDLLPVRLPVSWISDSNNKIIIEYEKKFSKLERLLSIILKSPKTIKRPLDEMNSELWLLMDGNNDLNNIIEKMTNKFNEQIIPAEDRITVSILQFMELGLVTIVTDFDQVNWDIKLD
ncbi:MAG: hypothetical protein ACKVI6_04740 [Candidatus Poseidoniales archaeon]|jgi:hypothetical protein|tara:strand:- start:809 stop:1174 length:366 start_codon:yes stop_codon:yes gene_type:complete